MIAHRLVSFVITPLRCVVACLARGVAYAAMAFLRCALPRLAPEQKQAIIARLVEKAYATDFNMAFETTDLVLKKSEGSVGLRQRLISRGLDGLNPSSLPTSLMELFYAISGGSLHYSQEGEDILLDRLLGARASGFYVDIGAHHATRFSNTFALYRRGWRGINVDATPGSMDSFRSLRPRDINIETAVSDREAPLHVHLFREAALNTADAALAQSYEDEGWEKISEAEVSTRALSSLLDQHLPEGMPIDLLSIDVEGEEMAVLRSGDWERYRPEIIIIEVLECTLPKLAEQPSIRFLAERGYTLRHRLFNSVVLMREVS